MDLPTDPETAALELFLSYLSGPSDPLFDSVKAAFAALGETVYDVVWLAGLSSDQGEFVGRFNSTVGRLAECGVLRTEKCVEQLDEDTLLSCKLIDSKDAFEKRIRRVKTKIL